jgi:hypothetical protein
MPPVDSIVSRKKAYGVENIVKTIKIFLKYVIVLLEEIRYTDINKKFYF